MTRPTCATSCRFIWATRAWRLRRWQTVQEAKELFCQVPFDLTILDLNVAGVDGWDVFNFIQLKDAQHPVTIYTGVDDAQLLAKEVLLRFRANAVVRKRSSLASLLTEIRRHLPKRSSTERGCT